METQNKLINNKQVYFADFGHLLIETAHETIEFLRGEQFCCRCAGTKNESTCICIARKEKRDGTQENYMSAGQIDLERACELVMEKANKTVSALKDKSFDCECRGKRK